LVSCCVHVFVLLSVVIVTLPKSHKYVCITTYEPDTKSILNY